MEKEVKSNKKEKNITNNKTKLIIKIISIVLLTLSLLMIGFGVYFTYLSNSKKIVGSAIETMTANFKDIFFTTNEELQLTDNFTITSDVDFNIQSDVVDSLMQTNQTQAQSEFNYQKILSNINNTQNKIVIKQDKTNKKAFFELDTKINNQDLYNTKYLIENSTEYYFVKGFLNTYINNGSSNYFESLDEQTTTKDNILYLYEFISNSLKENLKEEYFVKKQETTTIMGQEKQMTKVILKIDNKVAKEIAEAILNDLKNDKEANEILTSINEDFKKTKIKDNTKILSKDETITINSYADNIFYEIEKVEIIHLSNQEQIKMEYETNKEKSIIKLVENDKLQVIFEINKITNNKYNITVKNSQNKEIGKIKLTKSDKQNSINLTISDEGTRIELIYDSKATDITKKSHKKNSNINFKIVSDDVNIVNANIKINSEISRQVEIKEDISESVIGKALPEAEKQRLENIKANVILKLMQ